MSFVLCARNSQREYCVCKCPEAVIVCVRIFNVCVKIVRSTPSPSSVASHHASWQSFDTVVGRSAATNHVFVARSAHRIASVCVRHRTQAKSSHIEPHESYGARIRKNTENASLRNCESFSMAFTS